MLTRDDVVWAYRLFLDREPENEKVVLNHLKNSANRKKLVQTFTNSNEFIKGVGGSKKVAAPEDPVGPGRRITSWDEALELLAQAEQARKISEDLFLEQIRNFWFSFPDVPRSDPRTPEYRQYWIESYERLSKRSYQIENECIAIDETSIPFPYYTKNAEVIGLQMIAVGSVLRAIGLKSGSRILELGAGWGNTSLALAQSGFSVTVIDINTPFIRLINKRALQLGLEIETRCGDFFSIREHPSNEYDAVLFYEAFHHCHDHLALLDEIPRVLRKGGVLALAGETVTESIPYPWGINPNGEALWQITKNGWMELAFKPAYLTETLRLKGWETQLHDCPQTAAGNVFLSHRL